MDLSLQDSGPFFVRAVLPNLPNPPGYGPAFVALCHYNKLCTTEANRPEKKDQLSVYKTYVYNYYIECMAI